MSIMCGWVWPIFKLILECQTVLLDSSTPKTYYPSPITVSQARLGLMPCWRTVPLHHRRRPDPTSLDQVVTGKTYLLNDPCGSALPPLPPPTRLAMCVHRFSIKPCGTFAHTMTAYCTRFRPRTSRIELRLLAFEFMVLYLSALYHL